MNLLDRYVAEDRGFGTPCWIWTGHCGTRGYGQVSIGGRRRRGAHRAIWEHLFGPLSKALELHHECGVKLCVNPDHLAAVTKARHRHIEKRRDVCQRGHAISGENAIRHANGRKQCMACKRAADARLWVVRRARIHAGRAS